RVVIDVPGGDSVTVGRRWVTELLKGYGITELDVEAPTASLSQGQRRLLALARELARAPHMLVIEDLTVDMAADPLFIQALQKAANQCLIMTTGDHHAPSSLRWGGQAVWLDIQGVLAQGDPATAAPERRSATATNVPAAVPPWLRWVIHGRLAGMPRPGLSVDAATVAEALVDQGVDHVVCLEEQPMAREVMEAAGLSWEHFPIVDMDVPDGDATEVLVGRLTQMMDDGRSVVVHCKAGLGRTGTLLACCLMKRGYRYAQALVLLREINTHYIQSEVQHQFLRRLSLTPQTP
ncbi:MAG: dual specificity protein phosphatase family protein, partial [Myxococcota bacterium]